MSRKIYIQDSMALDDQLADIANEDPYASLLWPYFLQWLDDWGRGEENVRTIKLKLFPLRSFITEEVIARCLLLYYKYHLLNRYEKYGKVYMSIDTKKWFAVQSHISGAKRETDHSKCPRPPHDIDLYRYENEEQRDKEVAELPCNREFVKNQPKVPQNLVVLRPNEPNLTEDCAKEEDRTINCAKSPILTINCEKEQNLTEDCASPSPSPSPSPLLSSTPSQKEENISPATSSTEEGESQKETSDTSPFVAEFPKKKPQRKKEVAAPKPAKVDPPPGPDGLYDNGPDFPRTRKPLASSRPHAMMQIYGAIFDVHVEAKSEDQQRNFRHWAAAMLPGGSQAANASNMPFEAFPSLCRHTKQRIAQIAASQGQEPSPPGLNFLKNEWANFSGEWERKQGRPSARPANTTLPHRYDLAYWAAACAPYPCSITDDELLDYELVQRSDPGKDSRLAYHASAKPYAANPLLIPPGWQPSEKYPMPEGAILPDDRPALAAD